MLGLYAAYAWLDLYTPALIATSVVVGGLIGAEIPLLMALLQRIRAQDAGEATADLFAVDYVGALAGGLAFPFLLLPVFGQVRGAVVVAAVNLAAAVVIVVLLRDALSPRARRAVGAGVRRRRGSRSALAGAERRARSSSPPGRRSTTTRSSSRCARTTRRSSSPQARGTDDVRLFLDGDLQFASSDEHRYHEALVHPAVAAGRPQRARARRRRRPGRARGAAPRRRSSGSSRSSSTRRCCELARTDPRLVAANDGALDDPRVEVVVDDAMRLAAHRRRGLRRRRRRHARPRRARDGQALLAGVLRPGRPRRSRPAAGWSCRPGSPYFAPEAFWCIDATVAADRPARRRPTTSTCRASATGASCWRPAAPRRCPSVDPAVADELRFLDGDVLAAATVFPRDRGRDRYDVEVSTLDRPRILEYEARGWRGY